MIFVNAEILLYLKLKKESRIVFVVSLLPVALSLTAQAEGVDKLATLKILPAQNVTPI